MPQHLKALIEELKRPMNPDVQGDDVDPSDLAEASNAVADMGQELDKNEPAIDDPALRAAFNRVHEELAVLGDVLAAALEKIMERLGPVAHQDDSNDSKSEAL
jgi:hypothetical protein